MEKKPDERRILTDKIELVDFILTSIYNSSHGWVDEKFHELKFGHGVTWGDKVMNLATPIINFYIEDSFHESVKRGVQLNQKGLMLMHVYGNYSNYIASEKTKERLVESYIKVNDSVVKSNNSQKIQGFITLAIAIVTLLALVSQCNLQQQQNKLLQDSKSSQQAHCKK